MKFKYDIAVSFAGEARPIVEEFVSALAENDVNVFYDSWEQAQLWGKDLYQYLDMIYRQAARYCVVFVSESYFKKAWTKHELRSAQARAFQQNSEYILSIKLDDTELPGLPSTIAYVDLRQTSIREIANTLFEKIGIAKKPNAAEITKLATSGNTNDCLFALSQIAIFRLKDFLDVTIDIMLNNASSTVRERAAWALDNLNDEQALSAFITAIHDEKFDVRSTAGWGLVHLGDKVIPYMQEIIESDENPNAKQMASLVLKNL
ncbi:MAG TPA: TIR domain-containing protein [Anaerolineales bacterium]|nr:TIR domain-containing protein [Anaerolineales bacterium]